MKIKKIKNSSKNAKEDLLFAKRTEEAWKGYNNRKFIEMDFDDFLKKLKKK